MLVSTHDCALHEHFFKVCFLSQSRKEGLPYLLVRPAREAAKHAISRSKFSRQVTPWTSSASYPQHCFDEQTVICACPATIRCLAEHQVLNTLPLIVPEKKSYHSAYLIKSECKHNSKKVNSPALLNVHRP